MQWRGLHHEIRQHRLGAGGLCDQASVMAQAHHAVTHRGAFVILHGARQAAYQLHAGGFKFGGTLMHQGFLFAAPERQFEMIAHAGAQYLGIQRLDDVVRCAELKAFDDVRGLIFGGQKYDGNIGGGRGDLQCTAYVVAAGAGHVDIQQHHVGCRLFECALECRAPVKCQADFVGIL